MSKNKNSATNELLMLGLGILIIGLILASYSISTYVEIRDLAEKIDFEMIDNNTKLSSSDKYYKYVAISDFLTKKLNKNKDIPVKNASCVYMDYAQSNALKMYMLTNKKQMTDPAKMSFSAGNIRTLYGIYDNYKTCKHQAEYKAELENILKEIENADNKKYDSEERMTNFLSGSKQNSIDEYEKDMGSAYQEELTPEQYQQLQQEQQLLEQQEEPVQAPSNNEVPR